MNGAFRRRHEQIVMQRRVQPQQLVFRVFGELRVPVFAGRIVPPLAVCVRKLREGRVRRGVVLVNAEAQSLEKLVKRRQLFGLAVFFDVFVDGKPERPGRVLIHVPMHAGSEPFRQIGMDGLDRPLHEPFALRASGNGGFADHAEQRQDARTFFGGHDVCVPRPVVGVEKIRDAVGDAGDAEGVQNGEPVFRGVDGHPDALTGGDVQNQRNLRPKSPWLVGVLHQTVKGGAVARETFTGKHVCRGAQPMRSDLQHGVAGTASALQKLQRYLFGYPPDRVDRRNGSRVLRKRL